MGEVPEDVAENWIDQLTIKQFNEELKDVFPFVYRLVSEASKAKELNFEDIMEEEFYEDIEGNHLLATTDNCCQLSNWLNGQYSSPDARA